MREIPREDGGTRVIDRYKGIEFIRWPGSRFAVTYVWVNQGWRDAYIVARYCADLLIRYFMPNGRDFLQEWTATVDGSFEYVKSVNEKRIPRKWKDVLNE